nr:hypothetical protein [Secundilactobacillus kimchicus]
MTNKNQPDAHISGCRLVFKSLYWFLVSNQFVSWAMLSRALEAGSWAINAWASAVNWVEMA